MRPASVPVWRVVLGDCLLAGVLWVLAMAFVAGAVDVTFVDVIVSTALLAPLVVRRTAPVAATAAVAAVCLGQVLLGVPPLPANVSVLVVVYTAVAYGTRQFATAALGLALVGAVLEAVRQHSGLSDPVAVFGTAAFLGMSVLVAWGIGTARRASLDRADAARERARLEASEQAQQVRLAVAAERARIAREMHDVVAHSLAVVIAQADGGRYAAATSPQAAQDALATIAATSRTALAEMRRLLGVLREEPAAPASPRQDPAQPLAPQPGLDDIPDLIHRVADGGLPVAFEAWGPARPLRTGVQLTAYRVVQEALTNVIKHAGPAASARVVLQWHEEWLVVEVSDDGRGAASAPPGPGCGHGIIGMQERVALDGGVFEAGPRPGGGFIVRAGLPLGPQEQSGGT